MLFKKKQKTIKSKPLVKEYIADMDTGGIRFSEEQIREDRKLKDKLTCHYSGLPSIYAYEE